MNHPRKGKPLAGRNQQHRSQAHHGGKTLNNLTDSMYQGTNATDKARLDATNQSAQGLPGLKEKRKSEHIVIPDSDEEVEVYEVRDHGNLKHSKIPPRVTGESTGAHRSDVLGRSPEAIPRSREKNKANPVIDIDSDDDNGPAEIVGRSNVLMTTVGGRTLENLADESDIDQEVAEKRAGLSLRFREKKKSRYVVNTDSDEDEELSRPERWGAAGDRDSQVFSFSGPQNSGKGRHPPPRQHTRRLIDPDGNLELFSLDTDHEVRHKERWSRGEGEGAKSTVLAKRQGIVDNTAGTTRGKIAVSMLERSTHPFFNREQSVTGDTNIQSIDSSHPIKGKEKMLIDREQRGDDTDDIFKQATPNRSSAPSVWGDLDYQRLDYQVYEDLVNPDHCVAFMQMARDYMEHLRNLTPEQVDNEQSNVERFLHMINNDIAWPLVKTVVPEFRHPIIDNDTGNFALRYVLSAVQHRTFEHMVRAEIIPEYEQRLVWDRVKATIDYLSFIKDGETAKKARHERDEIVATLSAAAQRSGIDPTALNPEECDS